MNSRITVILHPNTTRVTLSLNDRMFNKERYSFSRERSPVGAEAMLLSVLNECTVGIEKAETSKNSLKLEISEGMRHAEYIPAVIMAITKWAEDKEYTPSIYCDDQRWAEQPVYAEWSTTKEGVRIQPGTANLGVVYTPWKD